MPFLGTTGGGSVKQYGGQANLGYFIKNSLRTRSSASAYLNRTMTTPTLEQSGLGVVWVKRGSLGSAQTLFSGQSDVNNWGYFGFLSGDTLTFSQADAASVTSTVTTTQVFRDPSSWYHIIVVFDSTQATAADRLKMYVNGSQITAFGTATYLSQNTASRINQATAHQHGRYIAASQYLDGYMGEINFIDGQALTPSSFGKTDAAIGQWIPKKFAGTYGTNGFYLKFADTSAATAVAIGKDSSGNGNNWTPNNIDVSTPTAIRSYTTTGSSTWIAPLGVTSVNYLVVAGGGAGGSAGPTMYDGAGGGGGAGGFANGSLVIVPGTSYTLTVGTGGTGATGRTRGANGSNSVFATITAIGGGGGGGGASLRDGASGGSGGGGANGGAAGTGTVGQGNDGGYYGGSPGNGGGGAGSVGGSASGQFGAPGGAGLSSSISGSPVTYAGGGGGGAYATPPGSAGSGGSGGGGNGGVNNASGSNATGYGSGGGGSGGTYNTTGTLSGGSGSQGIVILSYTSPTSNTYDAMIDTPTRSAVASNYCTLNPLNLYTGTSCSNGNLQGTTVTGAECGIYGTIGMTSGKFYWESTPTSITSGGCMIGIAPATTQGSSGSPGLSVTTGYGYYTTGNTYGVGGGAYGNTFAADDVIGCALDLDNGKIWWSKNGVWQASGDPAAGTNAAFTSISGTFVPGIGNGGVGSFSTVNVNFGQRPFIYTPPSGFKSLNTFNLP